MAILPLRSRYFSIGSLVMKYIFRPIAIGWVWLAMLTALVVGCSSALGPMSQPAIATELTVYRSPIVIRLKNENRFTQAQ
jgi:hypothetical protein